MLRPSPILLAHSYYLVYDPKQHARMKPYPPLGTLLTAALLRSRGHDVAFFDAMLAPGVGAFEAMLDDVRPVVVGILEDNFNFLTKMCTLRMREAALDMVRAARARGCRVAVNGSDAADRPGLYLAAGADAVLLGEAESTFLELIESWQRSRDTPLEGIAGLALPGPDGKEVRRTAHRASMTDLDELPHPAWDLADADAYRRAWLGAHGRHSWNMVTSRGCPYGCNWCAKPIFGRRYAQRSPENVAAELERLRGDVAPDHIWFADDIFGLTPGWIRRYADEVRQRGIRTPFMVQSRVNLMSPEAVAPLAAAGCEEVWMGVESGSQRVIDAMDKGTRIEHVRSATRTLKQHDVRACWFIQLGYPGEQWDDILLTRDLLRQERPADIGVSVAYPLPGTKFHDTVRAQLGPRRNWADTDELAMLFRGTYDTGFYRRIRDLLHEEAQAGEMLDGRWAELEREEPLHRSTALTARAGSA